MHQRTSSDLPPDCGQLIDRRRLIGIGAAGMAALAAIPAAVRAADPVPAATKIGTPGWLGFDNEILALWARRQSLLEQAGMATGDEGLSDLIDETADIEGRILEIEPLSPVGWHIQALILRQSLRDTDPVRGDEAERLFADRLVKHFGQMITTGRSPA